MTVTRPNVTPSGSLQVTVERDFTQVWPVSIILTSGTLSEKLVLTPDDGQVLVGVSASHQITNLQFSGLAGRTMRPASILINTFVPVFLPVLSADNPRDSVSVLVTGSVANFVPGNNGVLQLFFGRLSAC